VTRIGGLFEGYGGLTTGARAVLGGELAWYSEIEPAACQVLEHHWPDVPNLGDITAVDWSVVEPVDVLTGGFPCQDVSAAGKRAGLRDGTRSGLWSAMADAIDALRPRLVVAENVRGLLSAPADSPVEPCPYCLGDGPGSGLRALGAVLGDLADIGFDARWCGLRAADVGAPHGRFRVFLAAWPAPDADGFGSVRGWGARGRWGGFEDHSESAADADDGAGHGQRACPEFGQGSSATADTEDTTGLRGAILDSTTTGGVQGDQGPIPGGSFRGSAWGDYGPAVRRWELILGRPAPAPTRTGKRGGQQLSPRFVEWLMGLPEGWVTAVPGLSRNDQLKLLGNGVVPAQCAAAIRWLLGIPAEREAS
jgi:DNA (cytosine-5)-methyltransferase 1